jgi:hypothetical protein
VAEIRASAVEASFIEHGPRSRAAKVAASIRSNSSNSQTNSTPSTRRILNTRSLCHPATAPHKDGRSSNQPGMVGRSRNLRRT